MQRRLPKGEETLPVVEEKGKFRSPKELFHPLSRLRRRLFRQELKLDQPPSRELLVERMRRRIAQGRVFTIYRLEYEITPQEQLKHIELEDEIGDELLEAEQKLLQEELKILGGN